jgi:hypothetical protein
MLVTLDSGFIKFRSSKRNTLGNYIVAKKMVNFVTVLENDIEKVWIMTNLFSIDPLPTLERYNNGALQKISDPEPRRCNFALNCLLVYDLKQSHVK